MTQAISNGSHHTFGGFCGDPFLDYNATVHADSPSLSRCFQHTVLTWIPAGFIFILFPLHVAWTVRSKLLPLECTALLIVKYVVQCLLIFVMFAQFILCIYLNITRENSRSIIVTYDYITASIIISLCMIIILIALNNCRRKGFITSGVIFVSLVNFIFCAIPEFIDSINVLSKVELSNSEMWLSGIFCTYFALLLVQLFLISFADKPGRYHEVKTKGKVCPEILSSFLNQLTFWWFTSMCIQGWRRPLTMEDIWQLNDRDSSEVLAHRWQKRWLPRISEYMASKQPITKTSDYTAGDEKVAFIDGRRKADGSKSMPSVIWCLFLTFKHLIIPATCLKTIADTIQFFNPFLLKALIRFVENKNEPMWKGYVYAISMFIVAMLYTLLLHQYFHLILRFGMNLRTVLAGNVFDKVLRLSNSAQKERGVGEIVNVMSTDIQRFQDFVFFLNMIVSNPYQIIVAVYFLWHEIGPSVLAGVAVMILLIPVNYVVSSKQRKYQVEQMKLKDDRIKLMSEILNGMKVLKLYAWEESFEVQILKIREAELVLMRKLNYFQAFATFIWTCAPVIVSVATFAVYVYTSKEPLTAQKAFVALALFNLLRFPMSMLPVMTSSMVQAAVSNKRLKSFLCADELDLSIVDRESAHLSSAVHIKKGIFNWEKQIIQKPTLNEINFSVEPGQLVAVVGKVGSGKSSLLSAMLGEMEKIGGYVGVKGSVAYVSQQAWIQNMSLKENIIFSNLYNEKQYNQVIEACGLKADMAVLPAGDLTEIGEKGINLSGGQKQRVSLARAVYQNADIYLFDDPLSAVDVHVGKHIFENVISNRGMLGSKTRILVTHGLHYLKQVDKIFVITDGEISERGNYHELLQKRGAFAKILVNYLQHKSTAKEEHGSSSEAESGGEEDEYELKEAMKDLRTTDPQFADKLTEDLSSSASISRQNSQKSARSLARQKSSSSQKGEKSSGRERKTSSKKMSKPSKLIQEETTQTGRVKWSVYVTYFSAMGYYAIFGCVALTALSYIFKSGSDFWLSEWSNAASAYATNNSTSSNSSGNSSFSNEYYLGIYVALGSIQGIFVLLAAVLLAFATMAASRKLHLNLVQRLFRTSISFYDITPLGRILNRCGKDVDVVDSALASTIRSWIACVCMVISTVAVITIAIYYFGLVVLPLTICYYFVLRFYISTSRQLKRLESITRSPIYSHFQESITGANCIRAYGVQKRFRLRSDQLMDTNQAFYYATLASNRWLAVRLEFIGNLMVISAAIFAVLGRNEFNGGQVGVAISSALAITQALNWAVRMTSDLETNIVSVERIKEYTEVKTEAPWITEVRPSSGWPTHGSFIFDQYCLRYRDDLDFVLKDLSFKINGGEKIGIVGRTGAGKSSLTLALFRIVESAGGKIWLDGVDLSQIGLHDLRSQLTIIPQDPVLFSSNFRFNLDPFEKYSDEEIWTALEHAHLKKFVSVQAQKLYFKISEGGENLSVGQRQLVCLARALLRKTKVLILDEATAAVDLETDDLIQKSIRQYFADCTILTIAHRLNTIMDSDKIMVLSAGQIAEFDSPAALLKKPTSLFYALAKDAGLV